MSDYVRVLGVSIFSFYDKCDYFTFPIVNFPFISSNIRASSVHGVYISQLISFSRACAQNNLFLVRTSSAADTKATLTRLRCLYEGSCLVYGIRVCMHRGVQHILFCVFCLFGLSLS